MDYPIIPQMRKASDKNIITIALMAFSNFLKMEF
jgi:hypothetical protein